MQLDTSVQMPLNKLFPKCLGDMDIKENQESKGNGTENFSIILLFGTHQILLHNTTFHPDWSIN